MSKVLRATRYKIGDFGDVIPRQSLGSVMKQEAQLSLKDRAMRRVS